MMLVDVFEPEQIQHLMEQTIPVTRHALNSAGFADYMWYGVDGHRIQVERKQIDEILSGMDDVEEQLSRELSNGVEETILLYEGDCEPIANLRMATQSLKLARNEKVMVPHKQYNVSYTGLQAWFSQLDKAGITIVHTCHYIGTALTLVALYQNSQKLEHTTLKRYIKHHIYVEPRNEHVLSLMGIGFGEEQSKALIERYGTFWYTMNQPAEELANTLVGSGERPKRLGLSRVQKVFRRIGRNE